MKMKIITTTSAPGKPFAAGTNLELDPGIFGAGRSPTFVPVMMNFCSSDAGACGTVIFWKHVGHSITEPPCDESHFMCWPHTGHAYLNSLMALPKHFTFIARRQRPFFESSSFSSSSSSSIIFDRENGDDDEDEKDKFPLPPRVFALKTGWL